MIINKILLNTPDNTSIINFSAKQKNTKNTSNIINNFELKNIPFELLQNRALVSFKGQDFKNTLNNNYFQLSKGAQPDIFQKVSAAYLHNGNDVLVTAPTGTGKTAIALYVITKNLQDGKKTFYTTPLKALSNEKFRSFQKIFGKENVGLLTGDTKINPTAPIMIMTTEVYRNMIFNEQFNNHNELLDNLKTVVFDELHYLGDDDRGGIWEQSIILSSPKTQLLSLSATIGNNTDIAKWFAKSRNMDYTCPLGTKNNVDYNKIENRFYAPVQTTKPVIALINVPSSCRHVPLEFKNILLSTSKNKTFDKKHDKGHFDVNQNLSANYPTNEDFQYVLRELKKGDKLPAIFFVFSKKRSKNLLDFFARHCENLNSENEKKQISTIIDRYNKEGKYLGEIFNIKALYNGYAVHNAGLLPTQKELIEELFQKKLVKVVIATETLSAGINMPARTTVISSYMKPSSSKDAIMGRIEMTPNSFHQMAGRAGRRGIDKIGYCYTMSKNAEQKQKFDTLINATPNTITSAFYPDYSFVAGYYENCSNDDFIRQIADKSFYTFDKNSAIAEKKTIEFLKNFGLKRKILRKYDFLDANHNLKPKGKLLAKLNGYEQIPVIQAIANKKFSGMNCVELAAAVGAMANIKLQYDAKKSFDTNEGICKTCTNNNMLDKFIVSQINNIKQYNFEMEKMNSEYQPVELDENCVEYIYKWAQLNMENENSTENWAELIHNQSVYTVKDEGSVFKDITMTIDLLKQIIEICTEALNVFDDEDNKSYYTNLKNTATDTILLLSRPPITE